MNQIIKNISEYKEIVKKILKHWNMMGVPNVIALVGDLGSGKTTFTKSIAKALEVAQEIISPTFIIHREYLIPNSKSYLHHLDLYRLDYEFELDEIQTKNLVKCTNVIVIEWADKFKKYVDSLGKIKNAKITWIEMEYIDEETRRIIV